MNTTAKAIAGVAAGLAGLTGTFFVGQTTAGRTTTSVAVASGVIQQGACLPPNAVPDPCIGVVGTLQTALTNLGGSSYYVQWKRAYPADLARLRAYAATP